jgi:hypothetical protein
MHVNLNVHALGMLGRTVAVQGLILLVAFLIRGSIELPQSD